MRRPVLNPGTLHWSGEHWINYLRLPGSDTNSAMVSLYHTRYCPAGEGNVAFVEASGLYDEVIAYDDLERLPVLRSVSVDFRPRGCGWPS